MRMRIMSSKSRNIRFVTSDTIFIFQPFVNYNMIITTEKLGHLALSGFIVCLYRSSDR